MTDENDLRAIALDVLGPHGDPRARDVLRHAWVLLERDTAKWDATSGTMRAHRVLLHVDGYSLGVIDTHPGARDALAAALAAAVAHAPGETMHELELVWALAERAPARGYRDAEMRAAKRDDPHALRSALAGYVRGADAPDEVVSAIAGADIELSSDASTVRVTHGSGAGAALLRARIAELTRAARSLLASNEVRVVAR